VTVASVNAVLPDPLVMDYSAAKAALASFSKSLSKEVGPQGVRVNTVSPGPVATDLWLGQDGVAATVGSSAGLAALVVMVASDRAGNVTGADFVIDGGLVSTL
jgi:NAD(P)-dependent dehydrogenase (short-subunit alcohol dehydrogenase family)